MSTPAEPAPNRHRRPARRSLIVAALAGVLVAAVAFPAGAKALGWWGSPPAAAPAAVSKVAAPPSTSPSVVPTRPPATKPAAKETAVAETKPKTGPCGRKSGAAPATKITQVSLGSKVVGYGREGDTEKLPMAIAARPDGGSWLARIWCRTAPPACF